MRRASRRQRHQFLDVADLFGGFARHRMHQQRGDPGLGVRRQPLLDETARANQDVYRTSSSGTAAMASAFLPARYRSWMWSATSPNP